MAGITRRQQVFVEEYLRCWNATEAARRAGYAFPNKRGPELVVKSGIAEAISARLSEKAMSADEVLVRLAEQARADLGDFFDVPEERSGTYVLNLARAKREGKTHLIKRLRWSKEHGPEIELHDVQGALALLGKYHKLFTDKVEHSGEINVKGYQLVSPDDWDAEENDADSDI